MKADLDGLTSRLVQSELELVAKGYSQEQAEMATRYATRWARSISRRLPREQQDRALPTLLEDGLRGAPAWLDGCARAAQAREYAREMDRAARDGQFAHSIRDYGGGEEVDQNWRESLPDAQAAWDRRFAKA